MKICIVSEQRMGLNANGRPLTGGPMTTAFLERYRAAFDEVTLIARAAPVGSEATGAATVLDVEFVPLPNFGLDRRFVAQRSAARRQIVATIAAHDGAILRAPGVVTDLAGGALHAARIPYAVEVVGDPAQSLLHTWLPRPLALVAARTGARNLRRLANGADAVAYVDRSSLEQSYPARPGASTAEFSSIELPQDAFAVRTTNNFRPPGSRRLVTVASMEQPYKGIDVLLRSVASLPADTTLQVTIVGGGRLLPQYERRSRALGVGVEFTGPVSHEQVREVLWRSDFFVLASLTEGLPRAMIEAMAAGLPCLGTRVGGVPRLLDSRWLVPPGDTAALAGRIAEIAALDSASLVAIGAANCTTAARFERSLVREAAGDFHRSFRAAVERTRT